MLCASGKDGFHDLFVFHIPGIAAGKRVIHMPADHINSTPQVVGDYFSAKNFKGDSVDVVIAAVLDAADIPADHGRIISADAFNVAS